MTSATIRAVFFDAVGTLLQPESVGRSYAMVGTRYGSRLALAEIETRFRTAFQQEEEIDWAAGHRTSGDREVERWRRIVGSVFDDVSNAEACFCDLFDHFAQPSAWRVVDDAARILRTLAEHGLIVGIASNFDARLHGLVARMPGLEVVQRVVVSSEVGWKKPAAAFFAEVVRVSGVRAEEILFVGDDVENDYRGAAKAGLAAVLLDARGADVEPGIRRVGSLTEVLEIAACGVAG